MPDKRDYRVRAFLFIENVGVATGLYYHVLGLKDQAIDINPGKSNAEMRYVKLDNHYYVTFDLCFTKKGLAEGLYQHVKNTPTQHSPNPEQVCYVLLERCGHRLGLSCTLIKKYIVE